MSRRSFASKIASIKRTCDESVTCDESDLITWSDSDSDGGGVPSNETSPILVRRYKRHKSDDISSVHSSQASQKERVPPCVVYVREPKIKRRKKADKVNGVAARLAESTKVRRADLSLWQHERYMAARSSFVRPDKSEEAITVSVVRCNDTFGTLTLDCVEDPAQPILVVLNRDLIQSVTLKEGQLIRIYKPYQVHHIPDDSEGVTKALVDVYKFELINETT